MRVTLVTSSPAATEALGRRIGARLRPGDVVALVGPLGSGKTTLARGIAHGAGARGHVASPSFVLVREYAGTVRVYHADLYRLERVEEVSDLGLEELADGGVLVVEWADRAGARLPPGHLRVECAFGPAECDRCFVLEMPPCLTGRLAGVEQR